MTTSRSASSCCGSRSASLNGASAARRSTTESAAPPSASQPSSTSSHRASKDQSLRYETSSPQPVVFFFGFSVGSKRHRYYPPAQTATAKTWHIMSAESLEPASTSSDLIAFAAARALVVALVGFMEFG